jgi:hypothetical protein
MPARQQGDRYSPHDHLLADDDPPDFALERLDGATELLNRRNRSGVAVPALGA